MSQKVQTAMSEQFDLLLLKYFGGQPDNYKFNDVVVNPRKKRRT